VLNPFLPPPPVASDHQPARKRHGIPAAAPSTGSSRNGRVMAPLPTAAPDFIRDQRALEPLFGGGPGAEDELPTDVAERAHRG
jgi:hypothetical protein